MSVLVTFPGATRPWALPGLVAFEPDPEGDHAHGTRQQPPAPLARLLVARGVRWFPARHCLLGGDSGDGTSETARGGRQQHRHRTLVSPCSGEAAWYEPPPPRTRPIMGRPRVPGQQLASPHAAVANTAARTRLTVAWSGGRTRDREVVTGPGHWSRTAEALVEGRWVDVHAGSGPPRDESCFTTAIPLRPPQRVASSTHGGAIEPTCHAWRDDLHLAPTKGSCHATVVRLTPGFFG